MSLHETVRPRSRLMRTQKGRLLKTGDFEASQTRMTRWLGKDYDAEMPPVRPTRNSYDQDMNNINRIRIYNNYRRMLTAEAQSQPVQERPKYMFR